MATFVLVSRYEGQWARQEIDLPAKTSQRRAIEVAKKEVKRKAKLDNHGILDPIWRYGALSLTDPRGKVIWSQPVGPRVL